MKNLVWILILVAVGMVSCSRSAQQRKVLLEAERIVYAYPDSALLILEDIDPKDLNEDSLKALYAIVVGTAHKVSDNSMVADSLTKYAFEYYSGKNFNRSIQAGDLYAMHRFWIGDGDGSLMLLDSLIGLPNIPKNTKIELLRSRMGVGGQQADYKRNIPIIRQCMNLDSSDSLQSEYKRQLYLNYLYIGQCDSALILIDELIDEARKLGLPEQEFEFQYEKIAVLEEGGRYAESNQLADYIITHAPETSAMCSLHFWKALNYLNMQDLKAAGEELTIYDNYAKELSREEYNYSESFAGQIRCILNYQAEGKITTASLAKLANAQRDRLSRDKHTHYEQRQNALKAENRALLFKSQSERKTYIIVIVSLIAFILVAGGIWLLQKRKRKTVEAEERAETLQRMVDELQKPSAPTDNQEALRRAMLQQLNIIKMVAETPTEQNREMLRKISSVDSDSDGSLINWANVYEIVDNLHSGFYTKLHSRYGDIISEKEEQAIVLLAAGFSAKEISVITSQSAASVYVRKSSVKKKLGVPDKEDVIAFLRQELSH
ncbi:MAG: LuxR C-terminal-related transcriptional regulator [Bacteroides sp.]|nr:LuxR C-terminal-related transcriptional regulator [Bacteroides sp.]MCM1390868.1 LuxR C-terminal-related transcriptional regulator [Bacteroides sp.]